MSLFWRCCELVGFVLGWDVELKESGVGEGRER